MSGHDPERLADLIEAQDDITELATEVLTHVGTITSPKHFHVGHKKVLVVLPGWSAARRPADFLILSEETA